MGVLTSNRKSIFFDLYLCQTERIVRILRPMIGKCVYTSYHDWTYTFKGYTLYIAYNNSWNTRRFTLSQSGKSEILLATDSFKDMFNCITALIRTP